MLPAAAKKFIAPQQSIRQDIQVPVQRDEHFLGAFAAQHCLPPNKGERSFHPFDYFCCRTK